LQRAVDRGHGHLERLRNLGRGPAEHFAQHERGALPRWEVLQCGNEREADALAHRGRLVRVAVGGYRDRIGDRLEPMRPWLRLQRIANGADGPFFHWTHAARPRRQGVEADVGRDPIEPRPQRRATLEASEVLPRPHHGFLDRVLGVERGAEHAIAVAGKRGAVRFEFRDVGGHD
jgi:hypothetical protein